jgi:hypothetical protein
VLQREPKTRSKNERKTNVGKAKKKSVFFSLFAVKIFFLAREHETELKLFVSWSRENAKTKQTSLDILFQSFISLKANFFESKTSCFPAAAGVAQLSSSRTCHVAASPTIQSSCCRRPNTVRCD